MSRTNPELNIEKTRTLTTPEQINEINELQKIYENNKKKNELKDIKQKLKIAEEAFDNIQESIKKKQGNAYGGKKTRKTKRKRSLLKRRRRRRTHRKSRK